MARAGAEITSVELNCSNDKKWESSIDYCTLVEGEEPLRQNGQGAWRICPTAALSTPTIFGCGIPLRDSIRFLRASRDYDIVRAQFSPFSVGLSPILRHKGGIKEPNCSF